MAVISSLDGGETAVWFASPSVGAEAAMPRRLPVERSRVVRREHQRRVRRQLPWSVRYRVRRILVGYAVALVLGLVLGWVLAVLRRRW